MNGALHQRLRRLEKRLQGRARQRALAESAQQQTREQQVERAALGLLSDADLQVLQAGRRTPEMEGRPAENSEDTVRERYRAALDASARRLQGQPWEGDPPVGLAGEEIQRRARNKLYTRFPEHGPFRRELYPRHLEFFAAGREQTERCFMAANRVGKTEAAAYEVTLHLTGLYPEWWEGRRFSKAVTAWATGDTSQTVRDVVQEKLLGRAGARGTGMIPGDLIEKVTVKRGLAEAVDTIYVRHVSGGRSAVTLKSYQEGRASFQGVAVDVVWLDEEVPEDIYMEALTRLLTTRGMLMLTFTPLKGLTEVVLRFLPHAGQEE